MDTNKILEDIKKVVSALGGVVVFLIAIYFVYNFTESRKESIAIANQDASTILRPEIVALFKAVDKEISYLKDKDIVNRDFVEGLKDNSEKIDLVYPPSRSNPFIP